jgi:hypothetical protein
MRLGHEFGDVRACLLEKLENGVEVLGAEHELVFALEGVA